MDFMLLFTNARGTRTSDAEKAEMARQGGELVRQGKLKGHAPLRPEESGARVRVSSGKVIVTDGPFMESKEIAAGFFIVDAADRQEAIEIAKRCPHVRSGIAEVYQLPDRDVAGPGKGTQFLFLLRMEPDESDPDGSKYREMVAYDEALKREGAYVESSQLARNPAPARIEMRQGRALVTDGPFVETKEIAGGYYRVMAASRAEAIALAGRCPHAKWGSVEVRELIPVPR